MKKFTLSKVSILTEILTCCMIFITLGVAAFSLISRFTSNEQSLIYSTNFQTFNNGWKNIETGEPVLVPNNGIKELKNGITVVNTLPSDLSDSDFFHFYSCHEEFELFIDGKLRYSYTIKNNHLPNAIMTPNCNHFIQLSKEDSGKEIVIHTFCKVSHWSAYLSSMRIGQKDAICANLISENGISLFSGFILFILGILFLLIFIIFHFAFKQKGLSLLYLSGFVLNVAMWIICESKLKDFYISNVSLSYPLIFSSLHMATVFLIMFFNELQQFRYSKIYLSLASVIILLFALNLTLQLTGKVDFITSLPFLHGLMGISIVIVIITLFIDIKKKQSGYWGKLILIGFSIFSFFIVLEIFTLWEHFTTPRGIFTSLALISLTLMLGYTSIQGLIHNYFEQKDALIKSKLHEQEMASQFYAMQDRILVGLAAVIDQRDESTGNHIENTKIYVQKIGELMIQEGLYANQINEDDIARFVRCAPLHDVGKISTPDSILKKPGKLTEEEYEIMKQHAANGGKLLKEFNQNLNNAELDTAVEMATYHHEHWDGKGYPDGLSGEQIPLCARIMAVADVFDALRSPRVYKPAFTFEDSIKIMEEEKGTHFDPNILSLFLAHKEEFRNIIKS